MSIQPHGGRLTFSWDAVNQRRSMVDLSGGRTTYVYNAIGNLTKLTNPQGNRTTNTYDAAGQRTRTDLANRTWVETVYDPAGRTTSIEQWAQPLLWPSLTVDQWATLSTPEWSALDLNSPVETSGLTYRYDKASRRTSRLDESGNRVTWTYDNAGQLATETQTGPTPLASVWTYDPAGNRDTQTKSGELTSYTRNAADQVTAATNPSGTTTYKYDPAGNQTEIEVPSGAITTTTWDYESRQRAVEQPDGTAITFTYNCDDWRVQRDDAFDTVYYQYDKNNLLAELDGAVVQVQYTNEPNEFGNVISQYRPGDGEAHYYVFDALGSTVALTDNVSGKSDDYTYDAWGDVVAQTGATINPMQYVGQLGYYRDEDIQRTHVRRREYSDLLGRFFSQNPLRQAGGDDNLYRYVQNDPVNFTDPSGLDLYSTNHFFGGRHIYTPQLADPSPAVYAQRAGFWAWDVYLGTWDQSSRSVVFRQGGKSFLVNIDHLNNFADTNWDKAVSWEAGGPTDNKLVKDWSQVDWTWWAVKNSDSTEDPNPYPSTDPSPTLLGDTLSYIGDTVNYVVHPTNAC